MVCEDIRSARASWKRIAVLNHLFTLVSRKVAGDLRAPIAFPFLWALGDRPLPTKAILRLRNRYLLLYAQSINTEFYNVARL